MSDIEWVIEAGDVFLDGRDLANAVEKRGGKVHRILSRSPNFVWPRVEGIPVGFGSCNFVLSMSRQPSLCNGIFDFHAQLRCSNYYQSVYDMILGSRIFMPHGALKYSVSSMEKIFGSKVFIRPDSAIKEFDGQVFETRTLAEADTNIHLCRSKGNLIVLGEVCHFDREYRVFCRNGKAFGHSSYMPLDKEWEPAPEDAIAMAESAAQRLLESVGSMVVVDIGATYHSFKRISKTEIKETGGMSLIEINGINSSGFYGCDLNAYIQAMEEEARARLI